MITLTLAFVLLLYMTGLRSDRAGSRTVTEAGTVEAESVDAPSTFPASVTAPGLYRGHTAYYWATKYKRRTRQYQQARAALLTSPTVTEAINLAGSIYGNTATLWRKARCESNLNPNAQNPSEASGLFQFLPSTWRSTPFAGFSIFSAYANALAAGWMHAQGRGGEWVCR